MMREIRRDTNMQMYDEPLLSSARPPWENAFKSILAFDQTRQRTDPEITLLPRKLLWQPQWAAPISFDEPIYNAVKRFGKYTR